MSKVKSASYILFMLISLPLVGVGIIAAAVWESLLLGWLWGQRFFDGMAKWIAEREAKRTQAAAPTKS